MNIYILGGGCYGLQYARRLLLARDRGGINFENLIIVDKNKDCDVRKKIKGSELRIENSDWVEFLVRYIENAPADASDMIVPSHTAPHILGKTFFNLIKSGLPLPLWERVGVRGNVSISMADIPSPIGTPFEKKLEKGVIAVSMATWKCPANCTEPAICPHTHTLRHWDIEGVLKKWATSNGIDAFYVFPARHFAYAVSAIPAGTIIAVWRSLKKKLKGNKGMTVGVATSSACHGIVLSFHVQTS